MPNYEIVGKGRDTGRKRKRIYSAKDHKAAEALAEADGTEVLEISELPPEPPTKRQIEYATDIDIKIPYDITKDELSDLISSTLDHDKPSTERHRSFAQIYGVECTDYLGKKSLFDRIHTVLTKPGSEKDLISWFSFRVYRELVSGSNDAPIDDPRNPIFACIAEELIKDDRIVSSIRRYNGRDLIWFGEWTSPDGYVHTGGSNRTVAYKTVTALLRERLEIKKTSSKSSRSKQKTEKESGCMAVLILSVTISFFIILYFAVRTLA